MKKQIIALDADGVLLDYHVAYRHVWQKAFGTLPALKDSQAYWPWDRWSVPRLSLERRMILDAVMDVEFWSSIPAVPGAQDACLKLVQAGYELVCVTAVPHQYADARLENLKDLGYPVERVFAAGAGSDPNRSIKTDALVELQPVAFVDDFAPYFRGIPPEVHAALVTREPNGSPNVGENLALAHSQHVDLAAFASWWVDRLSSGGPDVL